MLDQRNIVYCIELKTFDIVNQSYDISNQYFYISNQNAKKSMKNINNFDRYIEVNIELIRKYYCLFFIYNF